MERSTNKAELIQLDDDHDGALCLSNNRQRAIPARDTEHEVVS